MKWSYSTVWNREMAYMQGSCARIRKGLRFGKTIFSYWLKKLFKLNGLDLLRPISIDLYPTRDPCRVWAQVKPSVLIRVGRRAVLALLRETRSWGPYGLP